MIFLFCPVQRQDIEFHVLRITGPLRSSAREPASRASSSISLGAVFAGSIPPCDDPMTSTPESCYSSTRYLQTKDDLAADYAAAGRPSCARISSRSLTILDDPMIYHDRVNWMNQMAHVGSTPLWHGIQQQQHV